MATDKVIEQFLKDGYVVIPNFLTETEIDSMKYSITKLIDKYDPEEEQSIFKTRGKQVADDYFINSGDKIRYFLEEDVLNGQGKLTIDKLLALNKIGHALHWFEPAFQKITFSSKVKDLIKKCGLIDPVVPQSMYIFKNAGKGGEVIPHQDATFLLTEPQSLIGLWFPLADATRENGCLWFQPGSHLGNLEKKWIRNIESSSGNEMVFKSLIEPKDSCYENENKFVAAPAPKGSCVLIHGLVIHKSGKNTSKISRPAYTFHVFDKQNSHYSEKNWLQPSAELPFTSLYTN